jgi:hypothetical protein
VRGLGDAGTIALCYEAGPCGYELLRLLARLGVACDVVAPPSLEQEGLRDLVRACDDLRRAAPRRAIGWP